MLDKATQLSQTDHSKYDAFVFVIMSHGGERDTVCGVDGESIETELLMSQFTATNCPSLENKPKLFFIQACRGNLQERSSPNRSDVYSDAVHHQYLSDSTLPRSVCPNEVDFLLFFATAPGYRAFRKEGYGSPFIQVSTYVSSINLACAYPFFFFCRRKSKYFIFQSSNYPVPWIKSYSCSQIELFCLFYHPVCFIALSLFRRQNISHRK